MNKEGFGEKERQFRVKGCCIALIAVFLSFSFSGCGIIHLHDQFKATASKEAIDQYAKIDLQQGIKQRKANFEKLEAAYVEAVEKRWAIQRDVALARAVNFDDKSNLRDLVLGKIFGVDKVLRDFDLTSRTRINDFKSAVTQYFAYLNQYDPNRQAFKKIFNVATQQLGKELKCIRSKDPTIQECTPTSEKKSNDKASVSGKNEKKAKPDPRLPTPLITLSFSSTDCLSVDVPSATTPSYLKYSFNSERPKGTSDKDFEEIKPKLEQMKAAYEKFNATIDENYPLHAKHCKDIVIPARDKVGGFGTEGKTYIDELTHAMNEAANYQRDLAVKRSDLAAKIKAYNEKASALGVTKNTGEEGGDDDEIKSSLEEIREVISTLDDFDDLVGVEVASKEQLKAIDALIEALVEGKVGEGKLEDDENLKKFAAVAGSVMSLRKQFSDLASKEAEIKLSVLLTQRKISEAKKNWAEKRSAIQRQRINLLNSRLVTLAVDSGQRSVLTLYDTAFKRLNRYLGIDSSYDVVGNDDQQNKWRTSKFSDFLNLFKTRVPIDETSADNLSQGLVELATAHQLERSNAESVAIKRKMLEGQEVLARNEMSVLMWDAIIRGPVSLVAAYHQTGIKPQELAQLIVIASGFLGVGVGN